MSHAIVLLNRLILGYWTMIRIASLLNGKTAVFLFISNMHFLNLMLSNLANRKLISIKFVNLFIRELLHGSI